ncbi:hypothetical protein EV643_15613, partial [Kribbella sp. VKM Ac-2527]
MRRWDTSDEVHCRLFKLDRAAILVWLCSGVIAGCRSTVLGGVG